MTEERPSSAAFNLGQGARIGKLNVGGSVAGRDVVVGVSPEEASGATDLTEVVGLLRRLEDQLAALQKAPADLHADAADELRKAREAGEKGDADRLAEKLGTAQGYIERIASALPAALTIAQTVATLAARVTGLA